MFHKYAQGLNKYNRLPFGIASVPVIFQQQMEKILQLLLGLTVHINDILINGCSDTKHLEALEWVLERLQKYGLRVKERKYSFVQPSVEYLGYIFDRDGHATPSMAAITEALEPQNVQQLRSFLTTMVNLFNCSSNHWQNFYLLEAIL